MTFSISNQEFNVIRVTYTIITGHPHQTNLISCCYFVCNASADLVIKRQIELSSLIFIGLVFNQFKKEQQRAPQLVILITKVTLQPLEIIGLGNVTIPVPFK